MEILLHDRELLALPGRRTGISINCAAGQVWITQQGDSRDHLLGAGEAFASRLAGEIVVTALTASRVALQPVDQLAHQPQDWRLAPLSVAGGENSVRTG